MVKLWNKMFILGLFVMAFVLSLNLVSAVPPVQTTVTSSTTGLEIFYPGIDIIKSGDGFDVNVHVFNLSNGYPIRNATCYLHTYNRTGDHTHSSIMIQDPVEDHQIFNEWVTRLNGANFTSLGEHSMFIQCNNSIMGGAVKFTVDVNYFGKEITSPLIATYLFYVLFIMGLFITCLYFAFSINDVETTNLAEGKFNYKKYVRWIFVTGAWMTALWVNYILWGMSLQILNIPTITSIFYMLFRLQMILTIPVMIGLWIVLAVRYINEKNIRNIVQRTGYDY